MMTTKYFTHYFLCILLLMKQSLATRKYPQELYKHLLKDYNKLIRPVDSISNKLTVYMGLKLTQLIDVDEKNQVVTTNVWVQQEWIDVNLQWDATQFGNVSQIYIPSEELWLPDIVLYNNADGNYELKIMTKASVYSNGTVNWTPPAVYQSSCQINVEFFPFDSQTCTMRFGSWTYDGEKVNLKHIAQKGTPQAEGTVQVLFAADMSDFYESVEWDILQIIAKRKDNKGIYPCCPDVSYPDLTYIIELRRKTLFYTTNLILPCVAIAFLSVLVFYLPSESGEKISLSISILLSLTVFFLLLSETIPPTSVVVPLIGKYLLFTMILVTLSIIVTVIVLNIHFRGSDTHQMSGWVRNIFLNVLPKLLLMQRPIDHEHDSFGESNAWKIWCEENAEEGFANDNHKRSSIDNLSSDSTSKCYPNYKSKAQRPSRESLCYQNLSATGRAVNSQYFIRKCLQEINTSSKTNTMSEKMKAAVESTCYIAEHIKSEDKESNIRNDWKYVAMVLDRLFLWIFTAACSVASLSIVLQAPMLYDQRKAIISTNRSQSKTIYETL